MRVCWKSSIQGKGLRGLRLVRRSYSIGLALCLFGSSGLAPRHLVYIPHFSFHSTSSFSRSNSCHTIIWCLHQCPHCLSIITLSGVPNRPWGAFIGADRRSGSFRLRSQSDNESRTIPVVSTVVASMLPWAPPRPRRREPLRLPAWCRTYRWFKENLYAAVLERWNTPQGAAWSLHCAGGGVIQRLRFSFMELAPSLECLPYRQIKFVYNAITNSIPALFHARISKARCYCRSSRARSPRDRPGEWQTAWCSPGTCPTLTKSWRLISFSDCACARPRDFLQQHSAGGCGRHRTQ